MRVRNKELRQRWHRKDQRIKELIAEAKKQKGDTPKVKVAAEKPEKKAPAPKKAAAPKAAKAADTADKPKRAPKKKSEEAAE